MNVNILFDRVTKRAKGLVLQAESFEEERIIGGLCRAIHEGLLVTILDEDTGKDSAFRFLNGKVVEDTGGSGPILGD